VQENRCAMCGKETILSDDDDKEKHRQHQVPASMILEQIDGTYYKFDTADCVLIFKKFKAVYGSTFADE
jgi:hypothetical protein